MLAASQGAAAGVLELRLLPVAPPAGQAGGLWVDLVLHNAGDTAMAVYVHTATGDAAHFDALTLTFSRPGASDIVLRLTDVRSASAPVYRALAPSARIVQRIDLRPWLALSRMRLAPGRYSLAARWQAGAEVIPAPAGMPWPPWQGVASSPPVQIEVR